MKRIRGNKKPPTIPVMSMAFYKMCEKGVSIHNERSKHDNEHNNYNQPNEICQTFVSTTKLSHFSLCGCHSFISIVPMFLCITKA